MFPSLATDKNTFVKRIHWKEIFLGVKWDFDFAHIKVQIGIITRIIKPIFKCYDGTINIMESIFKCYYLET